MTKNERLISSAGSNREHRSDYNGNKNKDTKICAYVGKSR